MMKYMFMPLFLFLLLSGCAEVVATGESTNIYDLDDAWSYTAQCKEVFTFHATDSKFNAIQGGYFDGEKFYIAANHKMDDGYEQTKILVLSKEGHLLGESQPLSLDHANNITYNPNTNCLMISHCTKQDNHGNRYSLVDPETLEITGVGDQTYTFFSMAYSAEANMYASGRAAGKIVDLWDENLTHVKTVSVECPDAMAQGAFCDSRGIYFLRGAKNGLPSEIHIYNWDCKLIRTIPIVHQAHIEPENINIVEGTVYLVCNDWEKNCGVVYTLTFTINTE